MIRKHEILTAGLLFIFFSLIFIITPADARDVSGKTFYTTANIWYENPEKIYSTNYHRGTILPAGTKVTIKDVSRKAISFEDDSGLPLRIIHIRKHDKRGSDIWVHFDKYFSGKNPKKRGVYRKFSGKEKDNIEIGDISNGMSKEAVLMAYGYPPGHRTPSLKSNSWIYWTSRFVSKRVIFKNNRVVSFGR